MTEPMTKDEAVQWLREWDELSQYDLDRVKGDIIATNRMKKRRSVVRYCLSMLETHVLVPKGILPTIPVNYVQKTINVARENAAWSKEQGEFFDERGTIKGPSERLLWQSALYTFWADALVAVLKEDNRGA